jgi:hypothetical protein
VSNILDDIKAIRSHFITAWKAAHPTVAYVFDNEAPIDEPSTPWVRLKIEPGIERRRSLNTTSYDQAGTIYLQAFVPDRQADQIAWTMAETFAGAFRGWRNDNPLIWCDGAQMMSMDEAGEPFMVVVKMNYTARH